MAEKVVVLDSHAYKDNRISKHMSVAMRAYDIYRLNFNFFPDQVARPKEDEKASVVDFLVSKNPYLNGMLFSLGTALGILPNRMARLLREKAVSEGDRLIFHVHDPYVLGMASKLKKRFPGSKIVYDRHEYYDSWKNRFGFSVPGLLERIYGRNASELIIVSQDVKVLPAFLADKTVTTIPNYPLGTRFSREAVAEKMRSFSRDGPIEMVYFGVLNLHFDRDIGLMLGLARDIMDADERVRFTVGGRIFDKEIGPMLSELEGAFEDRMRYLGEIPYDEVVRRTQMAHLGFFLLRPESPTWSESQPNSPNKVYEYLLSGTIPIIRAVIDDQEIIRGCSLMFGKDASRKEMFDSVMALLRDHDGMTRMMERCYETGAGFSWEKVSGGYIDCYRRVFAGS